MKVKIDALKKLDKYGIFFCTFQGETFQIDEMICEDGEEVVLFDHGWQGKDMDNFDTWKISGKGMNFEICGIFRNETDYENFLKVVK